MGCGKSSLGRKLAKAGGMEFMDMDKDNDMLVQFIRAEMVNAEKNLLDWNAFWREVYVNADVPYVFFNEFCGSEQDEKKHLESYGIDWFKISSSKSGQTPIKTLTIDGKYYNTDVVDVEGMFNVAENKFSA